MSGERKRGKWVCVRLGDIAEIKGGGTPSRGRPEYFGRDIDWVTPSDLPAIGKVQVLGDIAEGLTRFGLESSAATKLPVGSVLFSSRASIGKIAVTNRECVTNQGFANFVPVRDKVDAWFLAYLLCAQTPAIARLAGVTTFKEVSRGKLKNFKVMVPISLDEQLRIVASIKASLERVEEISTLHDSAVAEAQAVLPSLLEEMIRSAKGRSVCLADVCEIVGVLVDPRQRNFLHKLHVGGANIVAETGQLIGLRTAAEENLISGKFLFTPDDVLYSKIRPYLKKVARPDFSGLCSADMYPLRPKRGQTSRDFLFYLLLSRNFTEYAVKVSNRAGMPKVNRDQLFAYEFKLPDLDEQQKLVDTMDAAYRAALGLREELAGVGDKLKHVKTAILRKAFAGELR